MALTDGVVAIALTLLVLQLKVPVLHSIDQSSAPQLARALGHQSSQFISYLVSFYVIAVFWLAHHRVYRLVRGHREGLAWWNFAFLFTITLFPFSSALMGTYSGNPFAVIEFAVNLLLASLSTSIVIVLAGRLDLLNEKATPEAVRAIVRRGMTSAAVIAVSIVVAVFSPHYAPFVWILLAVTPHLATRMPGVDGPTVEPDLGEQ
jgi:uncharacterized membrane protein